MNADGPGSAPDRRRSRLGRRASLAVAGAALIWLGVQALGGAVGIPVAVMLAVDLAALAVFGWAVYVAMRLWRGAGTRQSPGSGGK